MPRVRGRCLASKILIVDEAYRLYQEIDERLLSDPEPDRFFAGLRNPVFEREYPFTMLYALKTVPQSPVYHPEGSVWNHTMLVLRQVAKRKAQSKNPHVLLWAALLHDIGKAETTKRRKGKVTAYDHDKVGALRAGEFLHCFTDDQLFLSLVMALVRWHMQVLYVVRKLPFADIPGMMEQVDVKEIALLGLCDRLGRLGADQRKVEEDIRAFLDIVQRSRG